MNGKQVGRWLAAGVVLALCGCKDLEIQTEGNADQFRFASEVHLWATIKDQTLPGSTQVIWRTDRADEPFATGSDVRVSTLAAGRHEIEVAVTHAGKTHKKKRKLTIVNDPPLVSIQSPTQGAAFPVGQAITLRGSATDTEDASIGDNSLTWTSSIQGPIALGHQPPTVPFLTPGRHVIQLVARDRAGAEGKATVTIEVTNQPPVATISEPSGNKTIKVTETLVLRGSALDPDPRIEDPQVAGSRLEWHSSRDGKLGVGATLEVPSLSGGTHVIELRAKDEFGKVGTASRQVTVENKPPRMKIKRPANDHFASAAAEVVFEAEASDPDGAPIQPSDVVWSSSKDYEIGRGFEVRTSSLSEGEHEITCTVTDKHKGVASAKVRVLITNQAPVAQVHSPLANQTFHYSDVETLDGSARDAEDGTLSGDQLRWVAIHAVTQKAYRIGTGSKPLLRFSSLVEELGFGRVDIRLVATDRDNKESAPVLVAIRVENRAPDKLRIGNPQDGAALVAGVEVTCSGFATDPDRNRLLDGSELTWTSRREDGTIRELGTGAVIKATFEAGTYDLTLTAIDPDEPALKTALKIRVTVAPAPVTPTPTTPTTTTSAPTDGAPVTGMTSAIPQ